MYSSRTMSSTLRRCYKIWFALPILCTTNPHDWGILQTDKDISVAFYAIPFSDVAYTHCLQDVDCRPGVPCEYPEEVDLRIIVIVYNRPDSLLVCLNSLQGLVLDGDTARLEIWIDRSKTGDVHEATVEAAHGFKWNQGPTRVHIQKEHVGIYGQWVDTWKPPENSKELAIILEDDVDLSKYAYRYLRAAHTRYGLHPFINGYTLYEGAQESMKNPPDQFFLYQRQGTWGFAPHPERWREFQTWFHLKRQDSKYHPYAKWDKQFLGWYRKFEREKREDSMWSIWLVCFSEEMDLWSLYPNWAVYTKAHKVPNGTKSYFAWHRRQAGLHYGKGQTVSSKGRLISEWRDYFTQFPDSMYQYAYGGKSRTVVVIHWIKSLIPGPWFNINMWSYQYRKSHCEDKTVVRSSYLHNGIS